MHSIEDNLCGSPTAETIANIFLYIGIALWGVIAEFVNGDSVVETLNLPFHPPVAFIMTNIPEKISEDTLKILYS